MFWVMTWFVFLIVWYEMFGDIEIDDGVYD